MIHHYRDTSCDTPPGSSDRQVLLATCYEKTMLNEEKKSYETALVRAPQVGVMLVELIIA